MIQSPKHAAHTQIIGQGSRLQQCWSSGGLAITAQLPPLLTTEAAAFVRQVAAHAQGLDAILTTEAPAGAVAVSSFAMAVLFKRAGIEAIVQISGRDRNRLALQGDLLGLGALGIPNLLIDMQPVTRASAAQNPDARLVGDLDGPALLAAAVSLRDEARFISGASIKTPPLLYLGALCSLEADSPVNAWGSAQFIVTPPVQDVPGFAAGLRAFQAAHSDFLQARPLVVSLPLSTDMQEHSIAATEEARAAILQQLAFSLERLSGLDGIRGFNLVVPNQSALAFLEDTVHTASGAIPGREQRVS
jgi:hypothetical protein